MIVPNSIASCMTANLTQHTYFHDTYLLNMSSFCRPTFCIIQHSWSNYRPIKLVFQLLWYPFITQDTKCLAPLHPPCFILWLTSSSISPSLCSIDPKYQKVSFLGMHYLTFQTNIFLLPSSSAEVTSHITPNRMN